MIWASKGRWRVRVALLFNLKVEGAGAEVEGAGAEVEGAGAEVEGAGAEVQTDAPPDCYAEYDSEATVHAVGDALRAGGHDVTYIEADREAYERLRRAGVDIVFNLAEGLCGESRESHLPAMLEMLGIPYTGAGVMALAVCLDKPTSKRLMAYHGIPTPRFCVALPAAGDGAARPAAGAASPGDGAAPLGIRAVGPERLADLTYPLFVKPAGEGSSMGVSPESVVRDPRALASRVAGLHRLYGGAVLVEEFLEGREFTLGIVGNFDGQREPRVLPPLEVNFGLCPADHGAVYSYHFKKAWDADEFFLCPAPVDAALGEALRRRALDAFSALGCRDVARVDLRLDRDGVPNVIEINPLPGLRPAFSDLPRAANADGTTYEELVNAILDAAARRYGLPR